MTEEDGITGVVESYFSDIFSTSIPSADQIERVISEVSNCLTMEAKSHLDAPFIAVVVKEDLFEMGAWKSHGSDGFHAGFFQDNLGLGWSGHLGSLFEDS